MALLFFPQVFLVQHFLILLYLFQGVVPPPVGGTSYHSASTMEKASPQPDLIAKMMHNQKTSTPSGSGGCYPYYPAPPLTHRSSAAPSPVPSTISSVLTNQSAFMPRPLPGLPGYQHPLNNLQTNCQTLGRPSQVVPMCAPSPGAASLHGVVGLPTYHTLGRPGSGASGGSGALGHPRPGYVTLPRR